MQCNHHTTKTLLNGLGKRMNIKKTIQSLAGTFLVSPLLAHAAGFGLAEQSGSGLGNAFANGTAAEDASNQFTNPAILTYVQGMQAAGALHLIKPSGEFNDEGSVPGTFRPLGGEGGDIGELSFVPNFYFKMDLNEQVKLGLGVTAPFGLKTEYSDNWIGRFQGIKSELTTININPALAFKVNDQLSLGFGVSAMWAKATLTSAVNLGAAESSTKVQGDDWGFGFNMGAIYQATADTRFGLAYRSKVEQHLDGDAKSPFTALNPNPNRTLNADVTADLTLPESAALNVFSKVNDSWDVMADVTWTRWSQFKELRILRNNGSTLTVTPENWENTMRYSIGANYHYNQQLTLRAGIAYDEEAIKDAFRTVRIPGNDRKWLAFGACWQATPSTKLDVGYAHLFISDTKIDDNQTVPVPPSPLGKGRVRGEYDASVDVLSMQVTHQF
jgi:long-chain fatty acid transport protein